jgi:hypothetical protein
MTWVDRRAPSPPTSTAFTDTEDGYATPTGGDGLSHFYLVPNGSQHRGFNAFVLSDLQGLS